MAVLPPINFYGNPSIHHCPTWRPLRPTKPRHEVPMMHGDHVAIYHVKRLWNPEIHYKGLLSRLFSCAGLLQSALFDLSRTYVCAYVNTSVLLDDSWSLCLIIQCRSCWQCMLRSQRHRNAVSTIFCTVVLVQHCTGHAMPNVALLFVSVTESLAHATHTTEMMWW